MNNRKGQNSILFLTTLGVYLGLVLVGATPQIIAQKAATTRNFDIRDEIEFKDDLDKKPDDDRSELTDSVAVYLHDVEQLIAALSGLKERGLFDTVTDRFEVSQMVILPCVATNTAGSYVAERFINQNASLTPALQRFSKQLNYGYSLGDCIRTTAYADKDAVSSRSTFKLDASAFSIEISVKKNSKLSAASLVGALPATFKLYRPDDSASVRQKIIDLTKFRADNDQVFVVTRLPRALIDKLLAMDVK
jgi:hypothetical protein